jgi:cytochrome P450
MGRAVAALAQRSSRTDASVRRAWSRFAGLGIGRQLAATSTGLVGLLGKDHQGFGGGGRHFCLGAGLARLELKQRFQAAVDARAYLSKRGGRPQRKAADEA